MLRKTNMNIYRGRYAQERREEIKQDRIDTAIIVSFLGVLALLVNIF